MPPRQMAVETPMILPVPTREAVEIINAPKEETCPAFFGFSKMTRKVSLNRRSWMNFVRKVK